MREPFASPAASPAVAESGVAGAGSRWTRSRPVGPAFTRLLAAALAGEWLLLGFQAAFELSATLIGPADTLAPAAWSGGGLLLSALLPLTVWVLLRWARHLGALPRPGAVAVGVTGAGNLAGALVSLPGLMDPDEQLPALAGVTCGLALAYGCLLVLRARTGAGEEPAPPRRRALAVAAGLTVTVYAGMGTAGYMLASYLNSSLGTVFDLDLTPRWALCTHTVDAACAARAAGQRGATVAWLPAEPGLEPGYLAVQPSRQGQASADQVLRTPAMTLTLTTGPVPQPGAPAELDRVETLPDGTRVEVSVDEAELATVELTWTRAGEDYRLSAFPRGLMAGVDVDRAVELAGKVRYAAPG